jgi:hypothetical protein
MSYQHIQITGLNTTKTHKDAQSSLFEVYLDLSAKPSNAWNEDFNKTWKEVFYSDKRAAFASLGYITITCMLDELEVHQAELEKVVSEVNTRQEALSAAQDARMKAWKEEDDANKKKIQEAANRFKKKD